jgi:hypothetical protein
MGDFDYTKVGVPDAPEPFSVIDLLKSMSSLEDKTRPAFVGGFFGDPGTRKTTRSMEVAQAITPPDKKILYIYTGQGWSTLQNFPKLKRRVTNMPYIRREQLETLFVTLMNPAMKEKLNIGAIVFDEINRMQDMDTDKLTQHRAHLVNSSPRKAKDKNGQDVYKDPWTPEWPEYNTTKVKMIGLINDALTLEDIHFFFVCHTRFQKGTGMIEPDFPEKTGAAFISMVHSLYYCKKVDVVENGKLITKYPIELDGTAQTVSKNRIGGLPNEVWSTQEIVDAYNKWGAVEKTSVVAENATGEPVKVDSTLESAVPTGTSTERTATAVEFEDKSDPIAAIMG